MIWFLGLALVSGGTYYKTMRRKKVPKKDIKAKDILAAAVVGTTGGVIAEKLAIQAVGVISKGKLGTVNLKKIESSSEQDTAMNNYDSCYYDFCDSSSMWGDHVFSEEDAYAYENG